MWCDSMGGIWSNSTNSCFKFQSSNPVSWNVAQHDCAADFVAIGVQGSLALIRSPTVAALIEAAYPDTKDYWIGLRETGADTNDIVSVADQAEKTLLTGWASFRSTSTGWTEEPA